MPSRNFAILTEVVAPGAGNTGILDANSVKLDRLPKDGHAPLHKGEVDAGTTHGAADGFTCATGMYGGLDVSVRVEIDPHDRSATTEGYGFSIPPLLATEGPPSTGHRLSLHSRRSQGRPSTAM